MIRSRIWEPMEGGRRNPFRRSSSLDHDREYPLFKPVDHHQESPSEFEFEFGSSSGGSFFQGMIPADEIFSNGKMLPCSCIHRFDHAKSKSVASPAAASSSKIKQKESEKSNLAVAASISRQNSMPARLQDRAPQIATAACSTRWMDIVNRFRKNKNKKNMDKNKNSSDDNTSITSSSSASSSSRRFLLPRSSSTSLMDDDHHDPPLHTGTTTDYSSMEPLLAFHSKSCFADKMNKPRPKKLNQQQQQQEDQNPHHHHPLQQQQQQQQQQRKKKFQQHQQCSTSSNTVGRNSSPFDTNNRRNRIYPKISAADMSTWSKDPPPKSKSKSCRRSKEFGWVLYEQRAAAHHQDSLKVTATAITTTPPQLLLNMPLVCMGDSSLKLSRFDPAGLSRSKKTAW